MVLDAPSPAVCSRDDQIVWYATVAVGPSSSTRWVQPFTPRNFVQRIPHLGLEADTRATAVNHDITVNESATHVAVALVLSVSRHSAIPLISHANINVVPIQIDNFRRQIV